MKIEKNGEEVNSIQDSRLLKIRIKQNRFINVNKINFKMIKL